MIVSAVAPGQGKMFEALRSFLLAILPAGVEVFQAQGNQVPEPAGDQFVVMTPIVRTPLSTNINVYADAAFTGSVAGAALTVSAVAFGKILIGAELFGVGVTAGTKIIAGPSGGGVGAYTLSAAQGAVSAPLAAGVKRILQPVQRGIQLDVHAADLEVAGDLAQRIVSLFRDEVAGDLMAAVDPSVFPLYADDARQSPFINAEQQYETRWTVDAQLQVNEAIDLTQQFADDVKINLHAIA